MLRVRRDNGIKTVLPEVVRTYEMVRVNGRLKWKRKKVAK